MFEDVMNSPLLYLKSALTDKEAELSRRDVMEAVRQS